MFEKMNLRVKIAEETQEEPMLSPVLPIARSRCWQDN